MYVVLCCTAKGSDTMAVKQSKVGVLINMDRELKSKLEELAKNDCRSLTNLINKILNDYINSK